MPCRPDEVFLEENKCTHFQKCFVFGMHDGSNNHRDILSLGLIPQPSCTGIHLHMYQNSAGLHFDYLLVDTLDRHIPWWKKMDALPESVRLGVSARVSFDT